MTMRLLLAILLATASPAYAATEVISGAASIDDNGLVTGSNTDKNYGDTPSFGTGYATVFSGMIFRGILRYDESLIPDGEITSHVLSIYHIAYSNQGAGTGKVFRILPANTGWVEGDANPIAPQVGSSCWNWHTYSSRPWAGGNNGCGSSGTDYAATALATLSWIAHPGGASILHEVDLTVAVAEAWRDGTYANAGVLLRADTESGSGINRAMWGQTENPTEANRPFVTITFIPDVTILPAMIHPE